MPPTPTAPAPQQTPPQAGATLNPPIRERVQVKVAENAVRRALERNSDGPGFAEWLEYDEPGLRAEFATEFWDKTFAMVLKVFFEGQTVTQADIERRMTPRLNAAVERRDEWVKAWATNWLERHREE
jgi:hypothetical protein